MRRPGSLPLLIEWSPTRVRVVDADTLQSMTGASIAECLPSQQAGREAIVAIGQGSGFNRTPHGPKTSPGEMARAAGFTLHQTLPLNPKQYVFGFRLGPEAPGRGRLAIVGAVKADAMRRINDEAASSGLRLRAIVPLAFGSWIAARKHSLSDCAVVDCHDDLLSVDIVQGGELCYSRSLPKPASAAEIVDEIMRTFSIADLARAPILSARCPEANADVLDDKEAIEYLSDVATIDKLLFSLAVPEDQERARARNRRWVVGRSAAASASALALGAYAAILHWPAATRATTTTSAMRVAQAARSSAQARLDRASLANGLLDVAFEPGQRISDMVAVLSASAPAQSWFTGFTIGRGKLLSISGMAMTESDVAQFGTELSKSPRFAEMKVVSTSKAGIGKKQVSQFTIAGKGVGCLAFDHPPKREKKT